VLHDPREERPRRLLLFGPFLELGAEVQWLRFQSAQHAGDEARALELAESALRLDPVSTEGWATLASHLGLDLASPEREPDLERRRMWFRSALSVLRRGGESARDPAELELQRGLLLLGKAEVDPELDPHGAPALFAAAAEAFTHASTLGARDADGLARYSAERARQ